MSTKTTMKKMPKTLYVRRDVDGEDEFLVAAEQIRDHCDLEEDRIVGEYELVEHLKVSTEVKAIPT